MKIKINIPTTDMTMETHTIYCAILYQKGTYDGQSTSHRHFSKMENRCVRIKLILILVMGYALSMAVGEDNGKLLRKPSKVSSPQLFLSYCTSNENG